MSIMANYWKKIAKYLTGGFFCVLVFVLAFVGILLFFRPTLITYDGAWQKSISNELRVRAGIFDANGNLNDGMRRVEFFPGESEECIKYKSKNKVAGNCLLFYVDVSDDLMSDGADVRNLLEAACRKEDFCKNNDLKLIEVLFVKKPANGFVGVRLGDKKFGLVEKLSYIVENNSWN